MAIRNKLNIKKLIILRKGNDVNITIDDRNGHIALVSNAYKHTGLITYEQKPGGDYDTYTKSYAYRSFSYIVTKYIYDYKHIETHDQINSDITSISLPYIFQSNAPFCRINVISYIDWINSSKVIMFTDPFCGDRYLCITIMSNNSERYIISRYSINKPKPNILYIGSDKEHFNNAIVYDTLLNNYGYPFHYGLDVDEFTIGKYITISDILYRAIISEPSYKEYVL